MKRIIHPLLFLATLVIFSACSSSTSTQEEKEEKKEEIIESITYHTENGKLFKLNKLSEEKVIVITPKKVAYELTRVQVASGVKYADEQKNAFWVKGNEFMWLENDKKASSGIKNLTTDEIVGYYATDFYERRHEGYDWVGVVITDLGHDHLGVEIRSRADKKEQTCFLDAEITKVSNGKYKATLNETVTYFVFDGKNVYIMADEVENNTQLNYFCSGGGSIVNHYHRIIGPLDVNQVGE
ncbi:MliC family protein [Flammeovirga agarivorans]|uniref:C-type lysozyme inhibitor domain-containing protein n=1 Tax=Flammeovirga agarivorans TaxID=2726742 RepID=A0A7X8SK26_9BACT|nr:MliC family protein [Flammeovirga agarivorans]NLR91689.1 hypothetical protein [Flammeovirga agarivorans]